MTIDTNQFWNLLAASQLLPQPQIQTLFAEFSSTKREQSAKDLAKWLVTRKSISTYQAKILLAGYQGPFQYANYTLLDHFHKGQMAGTFKAIHQATQHPVLLEFFAGNDPKDLKNWRRTEALVDKASSIQHPNFLSIFESVTLPNHRFVVSQLPEGVPLNEKIPRKGRIPWQKACRLIAQITRGLNQLQEAGIRHGSISPRCIWLQKGGLAQLRLNLQADPDFQAPDPNEKGFESKFDYLPPEWSPDISTSSESSDIYAMGCVLYRAIAGRTPFSGTSVEEITQHHRNDPVPSLSKYELPDPLAGLIKQMLAKDPADRPDDLVQLSRQLAEFSGKAKAIEAMKEPTPSLLVAYSHSLKQFRPGTESRVDDVPPIETENLQNTFAGVDTGKARKEVSIDHADKISAASAAALRRKKNRWKVPAAVGAALMLFSVAIAIWAYNADRQVVQVPVTPAENESHDGNDTKPFVEEPNGNGTSQAPPDFSAMADSERPILFQELIPDDNESLWETPTTGAPVDFSGLPAAAKLILVFRPNEIVSQLEGLRVIDSLGPGFRSVVQQWQIQSGLELADISQLIVSLHSTPEFQYEPFFVVTTKQPFDLDRLIQLWNRPPLATTEGGQQFYSSERSDRGFYVLPTDEADPVSISKFAFGSKSLVQEVAGNIGATPLTGSLRKMADWTDRDRHLNLLYLRNSLFNDEGQSLMGSRLLRANRELAIMIPDDVRGGILSLHLDEGTFLELMFDRNLALKPTDLKTIMYQRLRSQRDSLTEFVANIQPSPYWDNVRLKYDNMLADVVRNFRWDIEHGEVVGNCWLPPMAAHNLIGASELVASFSPGTSRFAVAADNGPQTIEELLAVKRDLNILNPPDLNLLIADIESEINDDFRGMPFKFRIRLLGEDLEKDGITKNQRPGELKFQQQPLSQILTQIMTGANPDKNITGPSDPNCKLIWVIAEDPEAPGEKAVLITTRVAAADKSYNLPDAFKTE